MCVLIAVAVNAEATDCAGNFTDTITFSSTSRQIQCVTVNIRGDDVVESEESFLVTFSSDNERDVINGATTLVTIEDDDGT